jgi:hypothetical protein
MKGFVAGSELEWSVEVMVCVETVVLPLVEETESVRGKSRFTCFVVPDMSLLPASNWEYMVTFFRSTELAVGVAADD